MINIRYPLNFIIIVLLVSVEGYSQNISSPYLKPDAVILQRGIYKTYEEFRANQPSENALFTVNEKNRIYNSFHTHTQYRIEFALEEDKRRLENCWGFCDGESVYMYAQTNLAGKENFEKLLVLGKYCGYVEFVYMGGSTYMVTSSGGVTGSHNTVYKRAIDLETGEVHTLTKRKMKQLLVSDPELLAQYSADKKKGALMFEYLQEFNNRYKQKNK
jgi:hypothetical protein